MTLVTNTHDALLYLRKKKAGRSMELLIEHTAPTILSTLPKNSKDSAATTATIAMMLNRRPMALVCDSSSMLPSSDTST